MEIKCGDIFKSIDTICGEQEVELLVIENDKMNEELPTIVIAPVIEKSKIADSPFNVSLGTSKVAMAHQIRVVKKCKLTKKTGTISTDIIENINKAIISAASL